MGVIALSLWPGWYLTPPCHRSECQTGVGSCSPWAGRWPGVTSGSPVWRWWRSPPWWGWCVVSGHWPW